MGNEDANEESFIWYSPYKHKIFSKHKQEVLNVHGPRVSQKAYIIVSKVNPVAVNRSPVRFAWSIRVVFRSMGYQNCFWVIKLLEL